MERFRRDGARRLVEEVKPGFVGRIKVRNQDYVVIHAKTFDDLYGLAQEMGRLSHGFLMVRKVVQLVLHMKHDHEASEIAFELLQDLTVELPELKTRPAAKRELVLDEDDEQVNDGNEDWDFELDPAQVKRPTFASAR
jgi:hypothetical protein